MNEREWIVNQLDSLIENIKRDVNWDYVLDELSNIMGEIDENN
jgi:hypothetical protein